MTETLPRRADGHAFFLDFDGTLIEIADEPGAVVVPAGLVQLLDGVSEKSDGALAILSGRDLAVLDALLAPARYPAAGVHGAELRLPGGALISGVPVAAVGEARRVFRQVVARHPALLVEDKGVGLALHYRAAPELEHVAIEIAEAEARNSRGTLGVQRGKMVVELLPAAADKGRALASFMLHPPFWGRRPVAVGDDLTDEAMFAAVLALNGIAVRVGAPTRRAAAAAYLDDPAAVRAWLAALG